MEKNIQMNKIKLKIIKLEEKLFTEQLKENEKFKNLGFGCSMRGYSKLKKFSFSKTENIKEKIKKLQEANYE